MGGNVMHMQQVSKPIAIPSPQKKLLPLLPYMQSRNDGLTNNQNFVAFSFFFQSTRNPLTFTI